MAKIPRYQTEDCVYKLLPLGSGLPLCAFHGVKEHRLADMKLQDFPMCDHRKCPMAKERMEKG